MLAINGMPDHIHIFIGMKPSCCLSDLVREIKKSSNDFIKEKKISTFKSNWQEGYGAFSYSHSPIDNVVKYVMNQKEHHRKKSFKEENLDFLNKFQNGIQRRIFVQMDLSTTTNPKDSNVYRTRR